MNPTRFSRLQVEKLLEENVSLRREIAILNGFNRTANIDKDLFKLNQRVDELIHQLRINQTQNGRDFEKSMEDYRKSKENLLELGKIQLFDQKFEKLFEQYKAIREEKKTKRMKTFMMLSKIKESSQAKFQEVNEIIAKTATNVREFVQKQEEILNTLDLESLKAIEEQEEKLCASGCEEIKKNTSLFARLRKTLRNRKAKITLSMESDEDISEDCMKKNFSVVLHNLVKCHEHSAAEDLLLVKSFLTEVNYKEKEILSVERINVRFPPYVALKITFPDEETVNELVKIPFRKFRGVLVQIIKYNDQLQSRKKI